MHRPSLCGTTTRWRPTRPRSRRGLRGTWRERAPSTQTAPPDLTPCAYPRDTYSGKYTCLGEGGVGVRRALFQATSEKMFGSDNEHQHAPSSNASLTLSGNFESFCCRGMHQLTTELSSEQTKTLYILSAPTQVFRVRGVLPVSVGSEPVLGQHGDSDCDRRTHHKGE